MTSREITAAALLFSAIWAPVAYKALTPDAIAAEPPSSAICRSFGIPGMEKIQEWITEQNAAGRDHVLVYQNDSIFCAW